MWGVILLVLLLVIVVVVVGILIVRTMRPRITEGIVVGSPLSSRRRAGSSRSPLVQTSYGKMVRNPSPPANQRDCNSCWAIATMQALSDRLRLAGRIPEGDQLNYYMFHDYMISLTPEMDDCESGAYLETGLKMSASEGGSLMSQTRDRRFDDQFVRSDISKRRFRVKRWRSLTGRNREESIRQIENELNRNGTVIGVINLFDSFDNFSGAGIYRPFPGERADPNMVHMVSIVGYDERDNTWILRNSYGTSWGYRGYFKIPRGDVRLDIENYAYAPEI